METETRSIQVELERILNSREFSSSPRLVRFLRYCVDQTCRGELESLKESMIGVNVFDRHPGYNPKADPIVRVHARRLREKLEIFYASQGCSEIMIRLPKGSYVAHFEEAPAQEPVPPPPVEITPVTAAKFSGQLMKDWRLALTLAMLVLSIAAAARLVMRRDPHPSGLRPLINLPGSAGDPAWAPNGKTVAFTWDDASDISQVYLLRKDESVPARLTASPQPEYRPVWSPDGKHIALLRESRTNHFAIVLVDAANRTERVLREILQLAPTLIPPALDWSPDGEWLVTSEQPNRTPDPVHLLLISTRDGRSWVITDPPNGSTGDLEARFSPDGNRILFRRGGHGELFVLSLHGTVAGPPTQLTYADAGVRGLSWSRDGKTIYFGSQRENRHFGIWRIGEGERAPIRITPESIVAVAPAPDPAGRSLIFAQPAVDVNLWLHDAQRPDEPRLVVPSTQAEYSPDFSPDGHQIAFISDRSGAPEVWIADLHSGEPRKVTSLESGDLPMWPSWSADGTKIAFFCRRRGLNYALQTDVASGKTQPLRGTTEYTLFPQYSKDGGTFYYVSNAGHRFRIWSERLFQSGSAEPALAEQVRYFRMSKDRQSLYFLRFTDGEQQLIQVKLPSKEEKVVWTFTDSLSASDSWDVSGNQLYYVTSGPMPSPPRLVGVDLASGDRRILGAMRRLSLEWQTNIAASPDGQSVIVTQVDTDHTELMSMRVGR